MARWIKKLVRKTRSRGEEKVLQSFELRCVCGSHLLGHRMETAQQVVCHECGEPRFVLPNNIYPVPKRSRRRKNKKKSNSKDESVESGSFPKRMMAGLLDGVRSICVSIALWFWVRLVHIATSIRKFFTPVRTVVTVVAVVICFTGWYSLQSSKFANAEKVFRASSAQAQRELNDGNLKEAAAKFSEADEALQVLGIDNPAKRKVHQYFLETNAITKLSLNSIESIVKEAKAAEAEGKLEEWNQLSATIFSEGWIVLDTHISNKNLHTETDQEKKTFIEIPHIAEDLKITIQVHIPKIRKLVSSGKPQRVILAFQFKQCLPGNSGSDSWLIETDSEKSFLWCHVELLETLGFEDGEWTGSETLSTVMKRQAEFLNVSLDEESTDEFEDETELP